MIGLFERMKAMKVTRLLLGIMCMALVHPAPAQADATCEYRTTAHALEHGGQVADSAWHVAHGDRPTCDTNTSHDDSQRHDDDQWNAGVPRRDNAGYHCSLWHFSCG